MFVGCNFVFLILYIPISKQEGACDLSQGKRHPYLVVPASCVILKEGNTFAIQSPIVPLPLKQKCDTVYFKNLKKKSKTDKIKTFSHWGIRFDGGKCAAFGRGRLTISRL